LKRLFIWFRRSAPHQAAEAEAFSFPFTADHQNCYLCASKTERIVYRLGRAQPNKRRQTPAGFPGPIENQSLTRYQDPGSAQSNWVFRITTTYAVEDLRPNLLWRRLSFMVNFTDRRPRCRKPRLYQPLRPSSAGGRLPDGKTKEVPAPVARLTLSLRAISTSCRQTWI
jgi:hypothetical protein